MSIQQDRLDVVELLLAEWWGRGGVDAYCAEMTERIRLARLARPCRACGTLVWPADEADPPSDVLCDDPRCHAWCPICGRYGRCRCDV